MRTEPADAAVAAVSGGVRSGGRAWWPGRRWPKAASWNTGADGHVTVRLVDGTLLRLRAAAGCASTSRAA
jgi:hypothetical protein